MGILNLDSYRREDTKNDATVTTSGTGVRLEENNKPFLTSRELATSTKFSPTNKLQVFIPYIEGSKWEVTYFQQIRGVNDELKPLDVNLPMSRQMYNRIDKLILNITNPISHGATEEIRGSATITAGFKPNMFDYFLVTLATGRITLLSIDNVRMVTHNNNNQIYDIEFSIFKFLDEDGSDYYNNLISKVHRTYVYDRTLLSSSPIITEKSYRNKLDLKTVYGEIVEYYLENFTHPTTKMISPPVTDRKVAIDPYLNQFIDRTLDHSEVKLYPFDYTVITKLTTIFDAIVRRSKDYLNRSSKVLTWVNPRVDEKYIISKIYNYHNVTYIKSPDTKGMINLPVVELSTYEYSDYNNHYPNIKPSETLPTFGTMLNLKYDERREDLQIRLDNEFKEDGIIRDIPTIGFNHIKGNDIDLNNQYQIPILFPDNYYVMSNNFYSGKVDSMGTLELNLWKYLNNELVNIDEIIAMSKQYHMWGTMDQYYLIPILLLLIKDSINNMWKHI